MASLLALRKIRGAWLFVVAAGLAFALAWLSLIVDPNAPDDSPWLVSGSAVALISWVLYRRSVEAATRRW
jgi:hypothetical protein